MRGRSRSRGSRGARSGAGFGVAAFLLAACSVSSFSPQPGEALHEDEPATAEAVEAAESASVHIDHAEGSADVVLRFDWLPDQLDGGELGSPVFRPGPEFTLYGDGTVIFVRNGTATPASDPPLERAAPFRTTQLTEPQVQALLQYALEAGGLATADSSAPAYDTDCFHSWQFTIRTDAISRDVQVICPDDWPTMNESATAFEPASDKLVTLARYLRRFDSQTGIETSPWEPDRYWAILRDPPEGDGPEPLGWPWPRFAPSGFCDPSNEYRYDESARRRAISAADAALLGLADIEGGIQGISVQSPLGGQTLRLALWPIFPEDRPPLGNPKPGRCPRPVETPTPVPTPSPSPEATPSPSPSPTLTPLPDPTPTPTPTPWPMAGILGEGKSQNLPFRFEVTIDHSGAPYGTFTGNVPFVDHVTPIQGSVPCARIVGNNIGVMGGHDATTGEAFTVVVSSFPSGMIIVLGRANCDTSGIDDPANHPITEGLIHVFPEPTQVGN